MGRGVRTAAFVATLALVASGCTGGGDASPAPDGVGASVPRGGTLRVGLYHWSKDSPSDPTTVFLLPQLAIYPCCLLRTLYYYNGRPAAEGGSILRPDLATGPPEVSSDGLTWSIHIRPGLRYGPPLQDVEITAPDFIRAIERILSPAPRQLQSPTGLLGASSDYFLEIEGAQDYVEGKSDAISGLEAPDRHTLRIHLTEQNGDLPYRLSLMPTAPIPPNPFRPDAEFGGAEGHERDGYGRFLVSSGPYMIEGSQKLDFSKPPHQQQPASGLDPLVLVRNPSWRRSSDPLRAAYVDRIEFTAFDRKRQGFDFSFPPAAKIKRYRLSYAKKVEEGEIDVVDFPAPLEQVRRYQADPTLSDRLEIHQWQNVRFLSLNVAQPPFDDVYVRRAVNYVIDKRRILDVWHEGLDTAAIYRHLAPDETENNLLAGYDPYPSRNDAGNLPAAKEEMRRSVYDRNDDGICDTSCDLGTILWRNDGANPEIAEAVRDDLTKIGIRFAPKLVNGGEMYQACFDPGSHANLCQAAWVADYPSASTFFPGLYSSDALAEGCCNLSLLGATPKQLRRWGYAAKAVPNADQRMTACQQAIGISQTQCWVAFDVYLMEEIVPATPLLRDTAPVIVSSRVASFSWDQVAGVPALDKIALKPSG